MKRKIYYFQKLKIVKHLLQTHTKPQEPFKLIKPTQSFSFKPSIILRLHSNWMVVLTSLEDHISIFITTEKNNKFELYTDIFNEFSFMDLKDELEEIFEIDDITPKHLQDEKIGKIIFRF